MKAVAARAAQALGLLLAVIVLNFLLIQLAPGDPAIVIGIRRVRTGQGLGGPEEKNRKQEDDIGDIDGAVSRDVHAHERRLGR